MITKPSKFKFIIYHWYIDLYTTIFSEVNDGKRVFLFDRNFALLILKRLVIIERKIPFKRVLKKIACSLMAGIILKYTEVSEEVPCFILPPAWLASEIRKKIQVKYPQAKFVCLFTDLVEKSREKRFLLESHRDEADLIVTYDESEAKKYNLTYIPLPYSRLAKDISDTEIVSDICFVGLNKGRLDLIYQLADYFESNGIRCDFHLVKVTRGKRKKVKGITYHDNFISYAECLKISARNRCILELVQNGSAGMTVRVPEAIFLNRKLLSNNKHLIAKKAYVAGNMEVFEALKDINLSFIKEECHGYPNELKESFSPDLFLERIECLL